MDGTQIVQVYFRDEVSSVMTPVKRLIAFKRVCLSAGETKRVLIQLEREDFSLVTADEKRVVEPGEFTLMVGFSSKHEDLLTVSFRLE
jgi:beta-glucosidase